MSGTELKPCPFCGGKAILEKESNMYLWYFVKCKDCHGRSAKKMEKEKAIKAWERRADNG